MENERLYHEEGRKSQKRPSQFDFNDQNQDDTRNNLIGSRSRSDPVDEPLGFQQLSSPYQVKPLHSRDSEQDGHSGGSKSNSVNKDGADAVSSSFDSATGNNRSVHWPNNKKSRDKATFRSFGMQSAQSDTQFADAIDDGYPNDDDDDDEVRGAHKPTALVNTPPSGRSH